MILRLSRSLATRMLCPLSFEGREVPPVDPAICWSADIFDPPGCEISFVAAMHDASLWTLTIPIRSGPSFREFLRLLLVRISWVHERHGSEFDPHNQTVVMVRRTDSRLISALDDIVRIMAGDVSASRDASGSVPWGDIERRVSETPFSLLGMRPPKDVIRETLRPAT